MVKYILTAFAVLFLLVIGTWIIAIPETTILTLIGNALSDSRVQVECDGFRKSLFFGFNAEKISVKKSERLLIAVDSFSGQIDFFSLIKLKPMFNFSGNIGSGRLQGSAELLRKSREVSVSITEVDIAAIPFFELAGLRGGGRISGNMVLQNNRGEIRFDLKEMKIPSGTFGNIAVPLHFFESAQGAMEISGSKAKVNSFTMEGPGVYARIRGDITDSRLALTLEMMPEKTFADRNPLLLLLEKYKVSPGMYLIPLTNRLDF
ncbi:MAG: type II secretion system protein GspN [Thermodesulfovibrio sp.]|nr:type II secretion system protein GspN [Thermodesulfovibrio sp.]